MATPPLKRKRHRISSATGTSGLQPPPPPNSMEEEEDQKEEYYSYFHPMFLLTKLISFQLEIIANCLTTLFSPFSFLLSLVSETFRQAEEAKESVAHAAARIPWTVAHGTTVLLKKIVVGFVGAVYVCMVVTVVAAVAVLLGVVLVEMWVEEPVYVRERLQFDYTEVNPSAIFSFGGGRGGGGYVYHHRRKVKGVPVGHAFYVSLVLLLPESDYNREIGVFQLTAELISTHGNTMAKFSQPCMLRFRSPPIRLMRTMIMGIPLLLGITDETQKITTPMLTHKEGYPRTRAIRVSMIPRAGTSFIPQLYEAEIIITSQLPWTKEIVRRWKWTFYVWTSVYIYIMLLIILVCWFKPLIFPMTTANNAIEQEVTMEVWKEPQQERGRERREVSDTLKRWQQSRSKRKAMLLRGVSSDNAGGSSASSISMTREETIAATTEEDVGDSDSVTFGGST